MIAKNGEQFGDRSFVKILIPQANLTKTGRIIRHEREIAGDKTRRGRCGRAAGWACGL
jgi:hypothetical protein